MDMIDDIRLIRDSAFFDREWYLARYKDVALTGLDPVEHYVRYGAMMGRNPSPGFDTARYVQDNPDVLMLGRNPLAHYLRYHRGLRDPAAGSALEQASIRGQLERVDAGGLSGWAVDTRHPGRPVRLSVLVDGEHFIDLATSGARPDLARADMDGSVAGFEYRSLSPFPQGAVVDVRVMATGCALLRSPRVVAGLGVPAERFESGYIDAWREGRVRPVTVVVPVYNAFDAVRECLASLAAHPAADAEVMVIDDCSTDPRIAGMLESECAAHGFTLVRNPENLGYTRTVNKGLALNPGRDVILLNSDTVVTERWIEALRFRAYDAPRTATVTALSNNAGAFSAPEFGTYNPVPVHLTARQMARLVVEAGSGERIEVPTGNGFCLYMRRDAVDALGAFDEEKYPRGYGEENDFCMRAYRAGWSNLICDKAYVFHQRSQSFLGAKEALVQAGARQLDRDYPEYRMLIRAFRDLQLHRVRSRVRRALETASAAQALPTIMFVVSTQTGGTPQTNLDLMRAVSDRYRCKLLRCDARTLYVSDLVEGQLVEVEKHHLSRPVDPIVHASVEYDRLVAGILHRHGVGLLHIRHVAWHGLGLPEVARSMGVGVVYSFHDFYSVCPSLNLLDENLVHCGGRCTATADGDCPNSLWPRASLPPLKHGFVHRWQEMFRGFLRHCDRLITTTESARRTLEEVYPELEERVSVIPHGRDFPGVLQCASGLEGQAPIRVLVPGNIGVSKGSELIEQMAELYDADRFEFHFLGVAADNLQGIGVHHGRYDRAAFGEKVRAIRPAFGVVLSVWPETYCHTLTEMWACGIPVLGIDVGAVGERIRASGAGWLVPLGATPRQVLDAFKEIAARPDGYAECLAKVREWQATEARWNDTRTMAERYVSLYDALLHRRGTPVKTLGMAFRHRPSIPPTSHIRVLGPWHAALADLPVQARPVDGDWLLAGGLDRLDGLLVQRDAVPAAQVPRLLEALRLAGLRYVYEIDDLLWEMPPEHPDHAAYAGSSGAIRELIANAAAVLTSTEALRAHIARINPKVVLMPNALSPALWREPIAEDEAILVLAALGLREPKPRLLYMGTVSHEPDLEMIRPALEQYLVAHPEAELLQIGGGKALPGARVLAVPREYSSYPRFVRWFRIVARAATAAVAPLGESPFNAMKSSIKSLDYGLAGLPAVFSDVAPYRDDVVDGDTGLLAANTTRDWLEAIQRLMGDAELRARLASNAEARALSVGLEPSAGLVRSVLAEVYGWRDTGGERGA